MNERPAARYAAWGLTWLAYASYYLGRKGFSVVKSTSPCWLVNVTFLPPPLWCCCTPGDAI